MEHFVTFPYTFTRERETNMVVASMMTCKICLIWRHMKTPYWGFKSRTWVEEHLKLLTSFKFSVSFKSTKKKWHLFLAFFHMFIFLLHFFNPQQVCRYLEEWNIVEILLSVIVKSNAPRVVVSLLLCTFIYPSHCAVLEVNVQGWHSFAY